MSLVGRVASAWSRSRAAPPRVSPLPSCLERAHYGCNAANGLWVIPGSHRHGKLDIKTMVEAAGSDRLPDAVPLICGPGDVAITNRQTVHGSFANTSDLPRVTLNMGFHRRRSVLNVRSGGVHNPVSLFDDAYIRQRARLIMYGIDARRQRYPHEIP